MLHIIDFREGEYRIMQVKKGDIFWIEFLEKRGSIQHGVRPAIISSNDLNNTFSPTINVIPLTSQDKKCLPVHVDIGIECGLKYDSVALVEQETTVDKSQIGDRIGACTYEIVKQLENAIQIQKGIKDPFDISRATRLIKAIRHSDDFVKAVLIQEFKSYCNQYGKDYKYILAIYNENIITERKNQRKIQFA
jgi:mRNA interferase MazF